MVKAGDIHDVVDQTFHNRKSAGYKKIRTRAADAYAGLSNKKILGITTNDRNYRKFSIRFTNKAKPRPVRVKKIHEQHQIDLINLSNMKVSHKGKSYRYILSLMDIFSRFHWLAPLERKLSSEVKRKLCKIYMEHGVPDRIQSDNGGEFKKDVKRYCIDNKIKTILCGPYHPQAQGKVERSHKVLRRKIYYDLVRQKNTGVNWVENLRCYQRCLNNNKREELGWKSAFEVYYGRKSNELVKARHPPGTKQSWGEKLMPPSTSDFKKQNDQREKRRNKAFQQGKRLDDRMLKNHAKQHLYKTYKPGEKVFVRFGNKKGRVNKTPKVLEGTILERFKGGNLYKVLVANQVHRVRHIKFELRTWLTSL